MSASLVGSEMCIRDRSGATMAPGPCSCGRGWYVGHGRCDAPEGCTFPGLSLIHISEPTRLALI
eukprot:3299016-Alexandrium_andersonii.AAC.1